MKRAVIALGILMILLASAAVGQTITETGISAILSIGEDKKSIDVLLYFFDEYGAPLERSENMILAWENEPVRVQVFPLNATSLTDFTVGYTTEAVMPKQPKTASPDIRFGWCFELCPQEIEQSGGYVRELQMAVTDRDGRFPYFKLGAKLRNIFKGKRLTEYNQLLIKTVPRSQMNMAGGTGGSDATAAVGALWVNQQKTAESVNAVIEDVKNIKQYLTSISGGGTAPATSAQTVKFPVNFVGKFISLEMRVTYPGGKVDGYVVNSTSQTLSLPTGRYTIDLLVDYGRNVVKKKMPIVVDVDGKPIAIDISQGGGLR